VLSDEAMRRVLGRIGVDSPVRFDDVTASTNATAVEMARSGAPEWTLVAAGHQTAGRGRLGRRWIDEPGRALMFSIVLRPELSPGRAGLISLLAGTAMARACVEAAGAAVGCKWPNDLMLGGAKVGGILSESAVVDDRIDVAIRGRVAQADDHL